MIQVHYLVRLSPHPLMAYTLQVKWIFIWLLHFSHSEDECSLTALFKILRTLKFKTAAFKIVFFATVNHNYDHKQRTLKHRNTQYRSKFINHKPWPFEPVEANFSFLRVPWRWIRKRQLAFERRLWAAAFQSVESTGCIHMHSGKSAAS